MTNLCVNHTTLNVTPPPLYEIWRRRQTFGAGAKFLEPAPNFIKGGVTLRVVYLTQGLVTLPKLVIHSWLYLFF